MGTLPVFLSVLPNYLDTCREGGVLNVEWPGGSATLSSGQACERLDGTGLSVQLSAREGSVPVKLAFWGSAAQEDWFECPLPVSAIDFALPIPGTSETFADIVSKPLSVIAEFMPKTSAWLSGNPICELAQANLQEQDLFAISRRSGSSYESRACSYGTLVSQMSADLLNNLSIGSMAFQSKWKYARADHTHDGTYTALSVMYARPEQSGENSVKIASIGVSSAQDGEIVYDVWVPVMKYVSKVFPEIGALKFVYSQKTMPEITQQSLESDDWDGWAYPNGQTFEVDPERFAGAIEEYGGGSGTVITLPDLNEFFEAAPRATDSFQTVLPQEVFAGQHQHVVNSMSLSGEIKMKDNVTLNTYVNKYGTDGTDGIDNGKIHRGTDAWDNTGVVDFALNLNQIKFNDISCGDCVECVVPDQGEFRPRNMRLPVMIYIGGVR